MKETTMWTQRSVRKEGKRCAGVETPLQPVVRWQAVSLQSMEVNGEADIHLQLKEKPMPEQVAAPKEAHDSEGSLH